MTVYYNRQYYDCYITGNMVRRGYPCDAGSTDHKNMIDCRRQNCSRGDTTNSRTRKLPQKTATTVGKA